MIIVYDILQDNAVLMDAILIILSNKNESLSVDELQYELLKCGLMVQQPLLEEAKAELIRHGAISQI